MLVLGRHVRIGKAFPTQIEAITLPALIAFASYLFMAVVTLDGPSVDAERVFCGKQFVSAALFDFEFASGPSLLREPLFVAVGTREATLLAVVVGVTQSGRMLAVVTLSSFTVESLANTRRVEVFGAEFALYQCVVRRRIANAKLLLDNLLCRGACHTRRSSR